MKNPKAKGNSYERYVCKRLSRWISAGERDDLLWRSASSGAVTTVHRGKKYISQIGDIAPIDPLANPLMDKVAIECKHYADLQVSQAVFGVKSRLVDFWIEHVRISTAQNKTPILLARQNFRPDILLIPVPFASRWNQLDHVVLHTKDHAGCAIYLFEEFLTTIPYTEFIAERVGCTMLGRRSV